MIQHSAIMGPVGLHLLIKVRIYMKIFRRVMKTQDSHIPEA